MPEQSIRITYQGKHNGIAVLIYEQHTCPSSYTENKLLPIQMYRPHSKNPSTFK